MKNDLRKLSPKEEAIMSCFWENGPMFVREVVNSLGDAKPHFNTVSTFVRGLEAKGWLAHEEIGPAYRYYPLVSASEWREKSLGGFVDRFFGKSYLRFVSTLVEEDKISTDELKELINRIEARKDSKSNEE